MKMIYRILFVEDLPSDVELAKHELKRGGIEFESVCVETKKAFVEALKTFKPDIILSDYSLPRFDGMTALKLTLEHSPTIPFILITGSMNEETAVECMKAGAVDYIIKQQIKRLPGALKSAVEQSHLREAKKHTDEQNEFLAYLVENINDAIISTDPDFKIINWNKGAKKTYGWSAYEALNQPFAQLVKPIYPGTTSEEVMKHFSEFGFWKGEVVHHHKNGTLLTILTSVAMLRDNENKPTGAVAINHDITERKEAEKILQDKEYLLSETQRIAHIGSWIWNASDNELQWSDEMYNIFGVKQKEFHLTQESFFNLIHPNDRHLMGKWIEQTLGKLQPKELDFRIIHTDGTVRYIRGDGELITDSSGKPEIMVGTAQDITERKRAEEELQKSEKILRESEERYHSLFDRMMDGVYRSTHEGRFVEVNPAIAKMFGYESREDMLKVDIKKDLYFAPSERDSLFMDTGQERTEIFRMRHKDGSEIWVEDHGSYVHDEKGNVIFHEGILRDVTARLLTEDELRKSEGKYKDIFTWAPVGIYQSSVDGKIITANKSLADILGYNVPEDLVNRNMAKEIYYNEEERRKLIDQYDRGEKGSVTNLEVLWKKKDGSPVWIMLTAHAIRDKSCKTIYYEGFVHDITERKLAEEEIRMLSSAMEQSPASVVITDLEGKIEYVNPKFTQVTGYTLDEALGQNPNILKSGEKPSEEYKQLWETIRSGNEWRGEFHNKKKNGELYWESASISPIKDGSGKITHYLAVKEDITEKKMLEQQFFRTQRLESIGTLAGGIAHDLNNVLAPILLSVDILGRRHSDEATKKILSSLESSALRGKDIIKQVLTFARGMESQNVPMQLKHLVNEIDNIIAETFPKNITKIINIPKDLLAIVGDATQIHQVLLNLCINARDAMPHGGTLSITASNIQIDAQYARMNLNATPGTYVLLNTTDTGTGIPQEILGKIFEPFFTTKDVGKGTGLGLSTVYTIIKNHGGFVEVQSELGKGTTFKVYFPAIESTDAQQIKEKLVHPVGGNGELILVVDDEVSILEITKQTLAMYGYNTLSASDGTEAIALYAQHKDEIDLVISDILMPTLDGMMTARTLRRMNPAVKIILTSGHKLDEPPSLHDSFEIDAFLQKPYTSGYLLQIVHDVLSRGK